MRLDNLGIPIYSTSDIVDLIYQGKSEVLNNILVEPDKEIDLYNQSALDQGYAQLNQYQPTNLTIDEFDSTLQQDWLMPEEYKNLDIKSWVISQAPPWDPESSRVNEELAAFEERNMLNLLRWLKYFVDTCRANGVVWGVGRGSSVASYVLYLIGVHRVDSIKYNLDWREFLR
jgi:DNA polymerase III alpha subunit